MESEVDDLWLENIKLRQKVVALEKEIRAMVHNHYKNIDPVKMYWVRGELEKPLIDTRPFDVIRIDFVPVHHNVGVTPQIRGLPEERRDQWIEMCAMKIARNIADKIRVHMDQIDKKRGA